MAVRTITQANFADLVEQGQFNPRQAMIVRLKFGIDEPPMTWVQIGKFYGRYGKFWSQTTCSIMRKVHAIYPDLRCPIGKAYKPYDKPIKYMMTKRKAERIIGSDIAISKNVGGYVRVACYDCYEKILVESGRNIPAALELLVRANYAQSRKFALERDNFRCTNCGSFRNLESDHMIARARGQRDDRPQNLRTLCSDCHTMKHTSPGYVKKAPGEPRKPRKPSSPWIGFSGATE